MPPPAPPADDDSQQQAATPGAEPEFPPAPDTKGEQADPFIYLRSFSTDEWRFLTAYLYRTAPITNRRGTEVYIGVYNSPIDQSDVMKEHGSGGYRMDVTQDPPGGGKRRRLRQCYFELLHPDHPPKVPIGEWVDDPRNDKWKWAKPSIMPNGNGQGGNPEAIVKMVLDYVEKARPNVSKEDQTNLASKIVSMVESNQKQLLELADPTKQLSTLKSLLQAIQPEKDGSLDKFVTMLMDDRKRQADQIDKLMAEIRNKPQERGFFDQLFENTDKMEKVQNFLGGGRGKTDWGDIAVNLGSKLLETVAPVAVALIQRAGGPAGQGPGGANARQTTATSWPPQINGRQTAAKETPAATSAPATTNDQPQTQEAPAMPANMTAAEMNILMTHMAKYGTIIQQCIPFMVDQYRADLTGYDFRDWFVSRHGMNWWSSMKKDLTATGLLAAAKYDPQLWEALQPEDKALKFFEQFFTPEGEEELPASDQTPDDDDEDDEPEAAQ
jgi:flagellar biosynthesis chaperone FliJ